MSRRQLAGGSSVVGGWVDGIDCQAGGQAGRHASTLELESHCDDNASKVALGDCNAEDDDIDTVEINFGPTQWNNNWECASGDFSVHTDVSHGRIG